MDITAVQLGIPGFLCDQLCLKHVSFLEQFWDKTEGWIDDRPKGVYSGLEPFHSRIKHTSCHRVSLGICIMSLRDALDPRRVA